jgi:serine/threonine-protein kinase
MTVSRAHEPSDPSPGYSSFALEEPDDRLDAGQLVADGRYRVVRALGHGGMAVVYEAEDVRAGRHVALKVVVRRLADRSDATARYHNEARLAAALGQHPHVVSPLAVGTLPELRGRLYLATELVRGRSLGALVLENPRGLPIERACRLGRDVARALVALHERGIVHRDVKPSNVMVEEHDGHERARLLDFGCAYATGRGDVTASADLTQAHERVGSPVYMAPEQALGLRPTPSFDLYALGATLYELLTGAPPYAGSSKAEIVERKCAPHDPPLPVARVRPDVPPRLAALVDGCLRREVSDRPESAAVVLRELEAVLGERGLGRAPVASRAGSTRGWWIGAAVVLVAAGVMVVFARPGDEPRRDDGSAVEGADTRPTTSATTLTTGQDPPAVAVHVPPMAMAASSAGDAGSAAADDPSTSGGATEDTGHTAPAPRPKPAPCPDVAAQAEDASRRRDWVRVLQLTKSSRCWTGSGARVALRVEALSELRLFEECVQVGSKSQDPSVQRLVKQCRKHLDEERTP